MTDHPPKINGAEPPSSPAPGPSAGFDEQEDIELYRDNGDIALQVFDMLNLKVAPKDPGDKGYVNGTQEDFRFPEESHIYAAEYCRLNDLLEKRQKELHAAGIIENEQVEIIQMANDKAMKIGNELKAAQEELQLLDEELDRERDRRKEIEEQLACEKGRVEEIQKEKEGMGIRLARVEGEKEGMGKEIGKLREEMEGMKAKLEGGQKKIENFESLVADMEGTIKDRDQAIADMNEENKKHANDLEEMTKRNLEILRNLEESKIMNKEFEESLREKDKKLEELNKVNGEGLVKQIKDWKVKAGMYKLESELKQETIDVLQNKLAEYDRASLSRPRVFGTVHGLDTSKHKKFHCLCDRDLKTLYNLKLHLKNISTKRRFKCYHCPRRFRISVNWRNHLRRDHNIKGCKICGKVCATRTGLKFHLRLVHPRKILMRSRSSLTATDKPVHPQDISPGEFSDPNLIIVSSYSPNAVNTSFSPETEPSSTKLNGKNLEMINLGYTCNLCKEIFPTGRKLKAHYLSKHNTWYGKAALACRCCNNFFGNRKLLIAHQHVTRSTRTNNQSTTPVVPSTSSNGQPGNLRDMEVDPELDPATPVEPITTTSAQHDLTGDISLAEPLDFTISEAEKLDTADAITSTSRARRQHKPTMPFHSVYKEIHQPEVQFPCLHCSRIFPGKRNLQTHVRQTHKPKYLAPGTSKVAVLTSALLQPQKPIPRPSPVIPMPAAKTRRNFSGTKKKHGVDWNKREDGVFCICGAKFSHQANIYIHINQHTLEKQFGCHKCPTRFVYMSALRNHLKVTHNIYNLKDSFGCTTCGKGFASLAELINHRKLEHPANAPKEAPVPQPLPSYLSPIVRLERLPIALLNKALLRLGNQVTQSSSVASTSLDQFGIRHEVDSVKTRKRNKKIYCVCGQRAKTMDILKKHIKRYTGRNFVCKMCPGRFLLASQLKLHMLKRHKQVLQGGPSCRDCGEFFPDHTELRNHHEAVHNLGVAFETELKHTPSLMSSQEILIDLVEEDGDGESISGSKPTGNSEVGHWEVPNDPLSDNKRAKCRCGKMFSSRSSLRLHVRSKMLGKRFVCIWCPGGRVRYDLHGNLKNHVNYSHPDVRYEKFACGSCAQTFPSFDQVREHRRLEHGK